MVNARSAENALGALAILAGGKDTKSHHGGCPTLGF